MIAASRSNPPMRTVRPVMTPPIETTAISARPPPMSAIRCPIGSWIGRPAPIAAASGSSTRVTPLPPANPTASSIARFSTSELSDGMQMQDPRPLEPRDPPALRITASRNRWVTSKSVIVPSRSGRIPMTLPESAPMRRNASSPIATTSARAGVDRDRGRLADDDPVALPVHERVRGPQVDREVAAHAQAPWTQWPSPLASVSFFQIGTSCFSRSIACRRRLERLGAMRRGHGDGDARLADREVAVPVHERDPADRPAREQLVGDLPQARRGELVPRLVGDRGDGALGPVVADRADEQTGGAGGGVGDEREGVLGGDGVGAHPDEHAIGVGHAAMLARGGRTLAR